MLGPSRACVVIFDFYFVLNVMIDESLGPEQMGTIIALSFSKKLPCLFRSACIKEFVGNQTHKYGRQISGDAHVLFLSEIRYIYVQNS